MPTRAVAAALAIIVGVACGAGTTGASGSPPPAGSPSTASVPEDLTFTGPLNGHLSSGSAGSAYVCASTGDAFVAGPILGDVGGQQVEMNITRLSFQGPGSYAPGGVSFDSGSHHYYPATGAPGSLVVAADLRSGTLDIDLAMDTNPNVVIGHVAGAWRCPPDPY